MIVMAKKDDVFCAMLEDNDFDIFKRVFSACTAEKVEPDQDYTDIIQKTNGECLRVFFDDPDIDHFVLLKENGSDDLEVIGESRICYMKDKTEFEDLHVLTPYRGRSMPDLLYSAMLKRVAEDFPAVSTVSVHIYDWNTPSIKAAKRNGFSGKGIKKPKGEFIQYTRSLDDIRNPSPDFSNDLN